MIVLDTAPWIWWVSDPDRLSRRARRLIEREEKSDGMLVSAVSAWEVALKHAMGKLELDRDIRSWIVLAGGYPGIRMAPLGTEDAFESALLPGALHRDPADRFIVTLARRLAIPLVTSDRRLRSYRHVRTVW